MARGVLLCVLIPAAFAVAVACSSQDDPVATTTAGGGATGGHAAVVGGAGGVEQICLTPVTDMPAEDCDIWKQDCAEGLRCGVGTNANGDTVTKCLTPKGTGLAGVACTVNNDCEHGLTCAYSRCEPVCCPDSDYPCGDNGYCILPVFFAQYTVSHCASLAPCALFDPGSCVGAQPAGNCHVLLDHAATACVPPHSTGVVAEGEPCSSSTQCGHAQRCSSNVCRYNCALDGTGAAPGEGACPVGQVCTDTGINFPNVGLCVL
jgi:hypothetical protein